MAQIKALLRTAKDFRGCEHGTTAIEYAFIAVLISTSIIAGATAVGSSDVVSLEAVTSVWPG